MHFIKNCSKLKMGNLNILHANSNTLVRIGLKSVFFKNGGIDELYEAENNRELFDILKQKKPELLIIDCDQPGHFYNDDIKQVRLQYPDTKVLIVSTDQDPAYVISLLELGVHGYLTRECDTKELINAAFAIVEGEKFYCSKIIDIILEKKFAPNAEEDHDPTGLSERETEITALISQGMTAKKMAAKLFLSHHTINTHRKNIMKKLKVRSTSGIVLYAVNAGLVHPEKVICSRCSTLY